MDDCCLTEYAPLLATEYDPLLAAPLSPISYSDNTKGEQTNGWALCMATLYLTCGMIGVFLEAYIISVLHCVAMFEALFSANEDNRWSYTLLGLLCEAAALILSIYTHDPSAPIPLSWVSVNGLCFSVSLVTNLWLYCKKE